MARRWRDYRAIVAKDRRFRWKCDFSGPAERGSQGYAEDGHRWEPDRLIVRLEESPHVVLSVTWPACDAPTIQPHLVRAAVEAAMDCGWPEESRELVLAASELELE